eukprot:1836409-Rhodomonas_salina.5
MSQRRCTIRRHISQYRTCPSLHVTNTTRPTFNLSQDRKSARSDARETFRGTFKSSRGGQGKRRGGMGEKRKKKIEKEKGEGGVRRKLEGGRSRGGDDRGDALLVDLLRVEHALVQVYPRQPTPWYKSTHALVQVYPCQNTPWYHSTRVGNKFWTYQVFEPL